MENKSEFDAINLGVVRADYAPLDKRLVMAVVAESGESLGNIAGDSMQDSKDSANLGESTHDSVKDSANAKGTDSANSENLHHAKDSTARDSVQDSTDSAHLADSLAQDSANRTQKFMDSTQDFALDSTPKSPQNPIDSPVLSTQGAPFGLFFFTSTCGVCAAQIPILQEIRAKDGIEIYAILGNIHDRGKAEAFLREKGIVLATFYERGAKAFFANLVGGVSGVPVLVLFDENGVMREKFLGLTPKSTLLSAMAKM